MSDFPGPRMRPVPGPDRGDRPGGFDRPRFNRGGPPAPGAMGAAIPHSVRLRDGEREIEVSGSAAFVRQTIDDLPILLARLRGETPPRPASISMPAGNAVAEAPSNGVAYAGSTAAVTQPVPSVAGPVADDERPRRGRPAAAPAKAAPSRAGGSSRAGASSRTVAPSRAVAAGRGRAAVPAPRGSDADAAVLEKAVLAVLSHQRSALPVVKIRELLGGDATGQAVRRVLERSDRVVSVGEKPATYRLR